MSFIDLKKEYTGMGINLPLESYSNDEKEYWNTLQPIEILKGMFKCSIEAYSYDKTVYDDVYEDDNPQGELHFIGNNNKIYDQDFNIVPLPVFKEKYGVSKKSIMELVSNKRIWVDIPKLSSETEGYCFIKFNHSQLEHYIIDEDENLKLS